MFKAGTRVWVHKIFNRPDLQTKCPLLATATEPDQFTRQDRTRVVPDVAPDPALDCLYIEHDALALETPKPDEHAARKARPMARGLLAYFPDALAEVAHVSSVSNEQHNPGQPIHWAKGKSMDHADCLIRHQADVGTLDTDGLSHTAKVAWRGLAQLQTELEAADPALAEKRQAQRDKAAKVWR